jgi:hypothetical protein
VRRSWLVLTLLALSALPLLAHPIMIGTRPGEVEGRVFESGSGAGIANLVVKLTPSKKLTDRRHITATDQAGEFRFSGLQRGLYLLEVFQGTTLLHRSVVDAARASQQTIELRRSAS